MTTYDDNLLLSYDEVIYYSDKSLGGAFEMTTGASSALIGEGGDGRIQSVCGSAGFLLVSRQYKNYYVTGNLVTANYAVQVIDKTSLGVYSNESCIDVDGKIIFLNKQGIWALYSGARCEEISVNIRGFFDTFSTSISFGEEAYFDLDSYPTYGDAGIPSDEWIRVKLDVQRNLLFFVIKGDGLGRALVLNLSNGEFYTWSGLIQNYLTSGVYDFKDICFINGQYYALGNRGTNFGVFQEKKNGPFPYVYDGDHKPRLYRTWSTAGEPSLEKKLNQVKFFGVCTAPVSFSHWLDWDTSETIVDGAYNNETNSYYSHKKRLTPANFLSVSVGMEIDYDSNDFQIESMELEFQPFQEGMKR